MNNWQSALWTLVELPGRWGDFVVATLALVAAAVLLVKMVLPHAHEKFSLLQTSRIIIGVALLCAALTALNWGWVKITVWLFVIGNSMAVFLLATNWCERKDNKLSSILHWTTARGTPDKREDAL